MSVTDSYTMTLAAVTNAAAEYNLTTSSVYNTSIIYKSNSTDSIVTTEKYAGIKNNNSKYITILLILMSLAGLTGNLLVILAILLVRKLRSNTNTILSSLATADLLVCVLVMPLGIIQFIKDKWPLGDVACSIYIFLDVCLCTSSILHMCAISIDRYLGIAYPLKYSNFRTGRATWLKIAGVWTLAALIACTVFIHAFTDPASIKMNDICAMNNQVFQVYGSLIAFYFPLIVMTATYFLTTRKLNNQCKSTRHRLLRRIPGYVSCNNTNHNNNNNNNTNNNATPCKHSQKQLQERRKRSNDGSSSTTDSENNSIRNSYQDHSDRQSGTNNSRPLSLVQHSHLDISTQIQPEDSSAPSSYQCTPAASPMINNAERRKKMVGQRLSCSESLTELRLKHRFTRQHSTIPEQEYLLPKVILESPSSQPPSELFHQSCLRTEEDNDCRPPDQQQKPQDSPSLRYNSMKGRKYLGVLTKWKRTSSRTFNSKLARERKASQVLGFVFLAFVISWTPFFIINIITAFCEKICQVPPAIMDFVLWLGYSASIVNPVIYTIINRHFQRAFKDMLTCRIWIERHKSKKAEHTLKACISNINGHVVAMSNAITGSNIRALSLPPNANEEDNSDRMNNTHLTSCS